MDPVFVVIPDSVPRVVMPRVLSRRTLLSGVAAVGLGALAWPAREAEAGPLAWVFREAAKAFIGALVGRFVDDLLDNEPVDPAPPSHDFHSRFSSQHVFRGTPVTPRKAHSGVWLEADRRVRADSDNPLRTHKDMNEYEMRNVIAPKEIGSYGTILHPCGYRRKPTASEQFDFEGLCEIKYERDPRKCRLNYVRPFRNPKTDSRHVGYGVSMRNDPSLMALMIE